MCIAGYVPSSMNLHEWMANHEDKYIRLGHYSSFNTHEPERLEKYFARDGGDFIQMATNNNYLYRDNKIRNKLRELIVKYCELTHSDGHEIYMFDEGLERLKEKEPTKYLSEQESEEIASSQPVTISEFKEKLEDFGGGLIEQIEQLRERLEHREERSNRVLIESLEESENRLMEQLDKRLSKLRKSIF